MKSSGEQPVGLGKGKGIRRRAIRGASEDSRAARDARQRFPIVALGASAGGLEALEVFFKNMPAESGLAFVVIQHLDPKHEDMLAELLQRHTAMPVYRIHDGMVVEPNRVHVIPPNRDLSNLHGVLYLLEHPASSGPRLPIDFFFRALAKDWRERSVGVMLSGMGTDGTAGLRAIKEQCPGGVLLLGNAETIGHATDLFVPLGGKERIYRRLETAAPVERMHFPVAFHMPPVRGAGAEIPGVSLVHPAQDLQALANDFLLRNYSPVAVLVSEAGDVLYINGKTGPYLEPAAGKANWNLFAMAREELNHVLFEVFRRAVRKKQVLSTKDVPLSTHDGTRCVDITVHPITEPAPLQGMVMVVFTESLGVHAPETQAKSQREGERNARLSEMSRELRHAQEELQVLREEMQTTGEELKSSNEELQSANEELQSMNEELTTSKEEMQAMNEELQVVNQDLMIKLQDFSRTNNDMKNLLSSTDTATLFLDNELNVRWFAPQTAEIIHLIPGDVGRPITDIVSRLDYAGLAQDTREVLRTLVPLKKEIPASDGRWFSVRIIPYRTKESMIDGLVITFLDTSETRKLAIQLEDCQSRLAALPGKTQD